MKKNKLYTVNKYNKHGFMFQGLNDKPENLYGFGSSFKDAFGSFKNVFSGDSIGNFLGTLTGSILGTSPALTNEQPAENQQPVEN